MRLIQYITSVVCVSTNDLSTVKIKIMMIITQLVGGSSYFSQFFFNCENCVKMKLKMFTFSTISLNNTEADSPLIQTHTVRIFKSNTHFANNATMGWDVIMT